MSNMEQVPNRHRANCIAKLLNYGRHCAVGTDLLEQTMTLVLAHARHRGSEPCLRRARQ